MDSILSTVTNYVQWLVNGEVPVDVAPEASSKYYNFYKQIYIFIVEHKSSMEETNGGGGDDDIMGLVSNPYHQRSKGSSGASSPGVPGASVLTECDYGITLDSHGRLAVNEQLVTSELISRVPKPHLNVCRFMRPYRRDGAFSPPGPCSTVQARTASP